MFEAAGRSTLAIGGLWPTVIFEVLRTFLQVGPRLPPRKGCARARACVRLSCVRARARVPVRACVCVCVCVCVRACCVNLCVERRVYKIHTQKKSIHKKKKSRSLVVRRARLEPSRLMGSQTICSNDTSSTARWDAIESRSWSRAAIKSHDLCD